MACCLIALVLYGRVTSGVARLWHAVTGQPMPDRRPRVATPPIGTWSQRMPVPSDGTPATASAMTAKRRRQAWKSPVVLGASVLAEIGLALVLWHWWRNQAADLMMDHSAMAAAPGTAAVVTVLLIEVLLVIGTRVCERSWALASIALLGLAAALASAFLGASGASHSVAMAEMVLLTTAIPIMLATVTGRRITGEDRPRAANTTAWLRLILAGVAAVALPAAVFFWHLPAVHHAMSVEMLLLRSASYLVAGTLLWFLITNKGMSKGGALPANTRAVLLGISYGAMGIVALAMIVGPGPLMPAMESALPWGALADQRAGGIIMMVGDILLVVPVIAAALAPSRPGSDTTSWVAQQSAARQNQDQNQEMELLS